MRQALIGVTMLLASVAPAHAAIFTYIVTGTGTGDTSEGGAAFGDVVVGRDFSARFEVDDALPTALYATGADGSSAQGGGLIQDGTRPPVRAVLTINGVDYAIRTGDKDVPPYCDPVIGCIGPSSRIDDAGAVVKDAVARSLGLSAAYEDFDSCCADYNSYYSIATDDLRFTLTDAAFTVPDYRQTGTFALSGTGSFATVYRAGDRSGGVDDSTRLSFAATALTVTGGVPEPASWAMMILGFGIVGTALRRRRQPVVA